MRVIQKSGNKVIPWRVDLETYLKYEKNENPISETSLKKLTSIKDTRFQELILAIERYKKSLLSRKFYKGTK